MKDKEVVNTIKELLETEKFKPLKHVTRVHVKDSQVASSALSPFKLCKPPSEIQITKLTITGVLDTLLDEVKSACVEYFSVDEPTKYHYSKVILTCRHSKTIAKAIEYMSSATT
jgi:hypothetical protein